MGDFSHDSRNSATTPELEGRGQANDYHQDNPNSPAYSPEAVSVDSRDNMADPIDSAL